MKHWKVNKEYEMYFATATHKKNSIGKDLCNYFAPLDDFPD